MGKTKHRKITLQELIAKKEQKRMEREKRKTAEFYVKSLDGVIEVKAPTIEMTADAVKMGDDGGNEYLIYQCCVNPNLKDPALREAYGAAEPFEVVRALFQPGEIAALSIEILKLAGYDDGSVMPVSELKN